MKTTYRSEDRIDLIAGNYVSRVGGVWRQHETIEGADTGTRVLNRTARSLDKMVAHDGAVMNVKVC